MNGGLPHWNLTSIYAGLDAPEFVADKRRLREDLLDLERFMDEHGVRSPTEGGKVDDPLAALEGVLERAETAYATYTTLRAYLSLRVSVDAFDEAAKAEASSLRPYGTRITALDARFSAWLTGIDLAPLAAESELVAAHLYLLTRAQVEGRNQMGQEAEEVAATLDETGGSAWGRLHTDLVSRETIRAAILEEGSSQGEYGLAELRTLQAHEDEGVRRRAYEAELVLLKRNEVSFAAAMNGIKGQVETLAQRRGWGSAFEESLFQHGITKKSLAAMHDACEERFDTMRGYLTAKAWQLGKQRLAWYDLFAPLPHVAGERFTWERAKAFIVERFDSYTAGLAGFAKRAFEEDWLDVPPRKGKRNGAFCMAVHARGESRVMLNFGGSVGDIFTMAHELGHAYHNDCKVRFGRTFLQTPTPMTLAETASIFCETIVLEGVLAKSDDATKLAVLEQQCQHAAQLILDIHSRYLFEATVFERRRERDLSVDELNAIMLEAQERTYGDALDPEARNPYMWAHKPHYYSSTLSFYNYPYTFGFLFGLGLYARYQEDPQGFVERYDELLASTGLDDAASLAKRFDIDIEDVAFWRASLDVVERRVRMFQELTERVTA